MGKYLPARQWIWGLVILLVGVIALQLLGPNKGLTDNSARAIGVEKEGKEYALKVGEFWQTPFNVSNSFKYCGMPTPGLIFSLSYGSNGNDFFPAHKKRIEYLGQVLEVVSVNQEEIRFKHCGRVEEKK